MIHHFTKSDLSVLKVLFSTLQFTIYVSRRLHRGFKHGIVNFQLVNIRGNYLIERTYLPHASWKNARKRYVSLDSFLSEVRSNSLHYEPIDDLPY